MTDEYTQGEDGRLRKKKPKPATPRPSEYPDGTYYRPAKGFVCSCGDTVIDRQKHDELYHRERIGTAYLP